MDTSYAAIVRSSRERSQAGSKACVNLAGFALNTMDTAPSDFDIGMTQKKIKIQPSQLFTSKNISRSSRQVPLGFIMIFGVLVALDGFQNANGLRIIESANGHPASDVLGRRYGHRHT